MNDLGSKVADNMLFVAEFAGLVFVIFLIAYLVEKRIHLKNHDTERILSTRKIALVGLFAAVSAVLMVLEVPVPFAPPFYKIDLSELPILIITFAFGPVAGVMTEFIKILLKLIMKSTSTAFVGELANFSVGCTLILPAGIIYLSRKTKKMALIACVTGTLCMDRLRHRNPLHDAVRLGLQRGVPAAEVCAAVRHASGGDRRYGNEDQSVYHQRGDNGALCCGAAESPEGNHRHGADLTSV